MIRSFPSNSDIQVLHLRKLTYKSLAVNFLDVLYRMDAGLPPLVTPTSQIIGAQAVSCALDELKGRPMYPPLLEYKGPHNRIGPI